MKQKAEASYLLAIALFLVFGLTSLAAVAKSDNAKAQDKGKSTNTKNFEKADASKGTTNSQLHKEKSEEVTKNLKEAAKKEEMIGNTEVSDQIEQVVEEQEQIQEATAEAIAEVEGQGKVKTFLFGTDYKNLGQLRSSLAHNTNDIRKLTKSLGQVQTPEEQALIEAQILTLTGERERIKTVIMTNEESFSLFGWVSKFLSGYEATPIDEQAEAQLTSEVEAAIENAPAAVAPSTGTAPAVIVQ